MQKLSKVCIIYFMKNPTLTKTDANFPNSVGNSANLKIPKTVKKTHLSSQCALNLCF